MTNPDDHSNLARRRVVVHGVVQGVGFRPFVHGVATRLGLAGWVRNDVGGVVIEIEGEPAQIDLFQSSLVTEAPPLAAVASVETEDISPRGEHAFRVEVSEVAGAKAATIPADVSLCEDCRRELHDPANRRYRYPFINCTNCGPRYTVIEATPYDRARTTMSRFPMCPSCQAEYDDPGSRRFHAEPNACPVCGPEVWFEPGVDRRDEAIRQAVAVLRAGGIVAIKGVGGFHLACRADLAPAVERLRVRKRRGNKPFAVMAATVEQAREFALLTPADEAALTSRERPIVLVPMRRRPGRPVPPAEPGGMTLAAAVAPGLTVVGVMLPYSPLHELFAEIMPLVMTSGNLAEEPIVIDNDDARTRLQDIADGFLFHDRPIAVACDDSVTMVADGRVLPIRRSRGYAPLPVRLATAGPSVLATGADLKATICLTIRDQAVLSHHLGDQETLETQEAFRQAVTHLTRAYRAAPAAFVTDLHPGYFSVRWAREAARAAGVPLLTVQHHHAHVAAVLAEHRRPAAERVIGVAFDGTGYGPDGTIWGGEFLVASATEYERVGHLASAPLVGGDSAIRFPRKVALGYLAAAGIPWSFDIPAVATAAETELRLLRRQIQTGLNLVNTTSAGRLFDAVASILGIRHEAGYEAEPAMVLEAVAGSLGEPYPLPVPATAPFTVPIQPILAAVVTDLLRGLPVQDIAARFHGTVVQAIMTGCRAVRNSTGLSVVALGGGSFQNGLLLSGTRTELARAGFTVLVPEQVPPNDGGISLGQAWVGRERFRLNGAGG